MALRDTPVLFWLNLGTMASVALFLAARPTRLQLHAGALMSLLTNAGRALGSCLISPLLLSGDVDWSTSHASAKARPPRSMIRALALTIPVLVVFAWLFSAADAVFKNSLESLGQYMTQLADHSQNAALHIVWSLVFCVAMSTILRPLCLGKEWKADHIAPAAALTVGPVEIAAVLGSLCALFLCFIVIQLRYLFGGNALVQSVAGLTYAEYARQGFFALLKVVFLLHVLLMSGHWLVKKDDHRAQRLFRWLSLGLIALTVFIFASAFFRLYLYVDAYGLTRARLYAVAVLLWLALVFAFFAVKLLWPTWSMFTGAYVHAFFCVLLCLNMINPDGVITRINLDRFAAGRELDQAYLGTLSCDAIATLKKHKSALPAQDVSRIIHQIKSQRNVALQTDWRQWNYGRSIARKKE